MEQAVLGIACSYIDRVVFIKSNGYGYPSGRVKEGETELEAMSRSFLDLTGIEANNWEKFAILRYGHELEIACFRCRTPLRTDSKFEDVRLIPFDQVRGFISNVVCPANTGWLLELAMDWTQTRKIPTIDYSK